MVTIDSSNTVSNAGTISVTDANGATGILAQAGVRNDIANSGKIIVDETYTPADADKDCDLDGLFTQGSGLIGDRTVGALTGCVANTLLVRCSYVIFTFRAPMIGTTRRVEVW